MARVRSLFLAVLVLAGVGIYALRGGGYGVDKQAVLQRFETLSKRLGRWTIPLFIAAHALSIALCMPYAVVFEAGAAYLFGLFPGILCVFSAKIVAASLSFWIGRAVFRCSSVASDWIRKNKYFHLISEGVARDGWKFVILARFSPIPSYVINYGLAATHIRFSVDFLLPTIVGCIPMILQNTSIGSLTSVATKTGGGSQKSGVMSYIFPVIGLASGVMISWRIKKYASTVSTSLEPLSTASDKRSGDSLVADRGDSQSPKTSAAMHKTNLRHRTCAAS